MLPTRKNSELPDRRKKGLIGRALTRLRAEREAQAQEVERRLRGRARIGFLIDATSSRSYTWAQAQDIQAQMFTAVASQCPMALRLVHFGGNRVTDHGWMDDADTVAAAMSEVSCIAGSTRIAKGLRTFLEGHHKPGAIILVGDSVEEKANDLIIAAQALRREEIKIFSFLEGDCRHTGVAFTSLADITGGKFARFGDDLPLRDLCEGVALMTAGGSDAAAMIENREVRRLLLSGPAKS